MNRKSYYSLYSNRIPVCQATRENFSLRHSRDHVKNILGLFLSKISVDAQFHARLLLSLVELFILSELFYCITTILYIQYFKRSIVRSSCPIRLGRLDSTVNLRKFIREPVAGRRGKHSCLTRNMKREALDICFVHRSTGTEEHTLREPKFNAIENQKKR